MSSKFTIESTASTGFPVKPAINVNVIARELADGSMGQAVGRAAAIGLVALQSQVNSIGRVTGNLRNSVIMRVAPSSGRHKAFAEVGFSQDGGQHAHLVEYGTLPRTTKSKGVFSSWKTRGKWVGMGSYPSNFFSGREYVRGMPALYPLQKAMNKSRSQMSSVLRVELGKVGTEAIDAGTKELKGSTFRRVQ